MKQLYRSFLVLVVAVAVGCSGKPDNGQPNNKDQQPQGDAGLKDKLMLAKEPTGAKNVIEARKSVKDGDDVVIVARIGGSGKPFTKGRLAFNIIDMSKQPCDDDGCGNPWCELDKKELAESTAFVKFEEGGKTLSHDAEQSLGLKLLQVVVVTGKAKRDDSGNLTIVATGIHVKS